MRGRGRSTLAVLTLLVLFYFSAAAVVTAPTAAATLEADPIQDSLKGQAESLEKQMEESKTAFASVDGEKGGGIAAKHLIEKGHRKVGVLSDPLGYDIICQRVEGFSKQCKKDRINKIPVFELPEANNTLPNLVSIIKNRLTEITESKVTAVFLAHKTIAVSKTLQLL